ncbi:hypothetical protein [Pseudocolwellia sp. HL-MZ7]|uniref:hypothetical protein n=1 Tax=Pseudocolwellia sp. HL-MZ7 TaxID=3400627 RepID=UPI003CEC838F
MSIQDTLGNESWLRSNENNVKALFPVKFTMIHHLNSIKLGSDLKNLGVDWHSEKEFEMIMVFLEKLGFIIRDGKAVMRNPESIFC